MDIEAIVSAVQGELGLQVDGKAGPETWAAIQWRLFLGQPLFSPPRRVDDRSEKVLATLQAPVQPYARALVLKAASAGIVIRVISGLRTYDEQNALYAQGRTAAGRIVTNARAGYSNHNFGVAFDIGVFEGSKYLDESPRYKAVGALGLELGLEWGGNWKTIQDEPHFQLRPVWAVSLSERDMLAELRTRKLAGQGFYA